jgi:ribulose 1,5-bisphosphate carboxylase large subunit-like protein
VFGHADGPAAGARALRAASGVPLAERERAG